MAATLNAVGLARQEFIATHRGPFLNDEGHRFIWVTVVNTGANDAIIERWGADLALRRDDNDEWEIPGLDAEAKAVEPREKTPGRAQD